MRQTCRFSVCRWMDQLKLACIDLSDGALVWLEQTPGDVSLLTEPAQHAHCALLACVLSGAAARHCEGSNGLNTTSSTKKCTMLLSVTDWW